MNLITVEGGKKEQRQIVEDVVSYMIQRQMPRMRTLDIHVTLKKIDDAFPYVKRKMIDELHTEIIENDQNCNYLDLEEWIGSVAITSQLIEKYEPQTFRDYKNRISHFSDAGWSFSSFGGEKRIREKLEAFGHVELNKEEYKNTEHFKRCIETGEDLFNRKVNKKRVNKNFFPNDLLKLMEENLNFYFYSNTSN